MAARRKKAVEAEGPKDYAKAAKAAKKAKAAGNNGNGSIVELTKELWQAAVTLRGSIEPADYKRYVLPIIFLRFLSLRYDKRRGELEQLVLRDPKSEYYGDKKALDDPDEYRSAGAFVVPEEARWESIRKAAQADDIKVKLDKVLELLEKKYPDKLRGLLPPIYAGSNMSADSLRGLINLFSKEVFTLDHGGEDLIGRVYEYFIGEFASSEGKRGGEYFTPASIVKTLVAMLEPTKGVVFDPCCGSGGMFVQSDLFTKHNHQLSFVGQEAKDFTYRLCRMNLFIHGIDGNIQLGNSYIDDKHATLKADYILANPPFNDGSKGENGWGASKIPDNDPRITVGGSKLTLSPRNANTMWILHFLHHLKETGSAGFVMAGGEMASRELARLAVRQTLVEHDYVDCVVQLSGKLFSNTQSPCALWLLSRNRNGGAGSRKRTGEVLFVDGRKLGALIQGQRRQKQLSDTDISQIADLVREFRRTRRPDSTPGFAHVATLAEIAKRRFSLSPGPYVGSGDSDAADEPLEDVLPRLLANLSRENVAAERLREALDRRLASLPALAEAIGDVFADTADGVAPKGWSFRAVGECTTLVRRGIAPKYLEVGGLCVLNQKCVRAGRVEFGPARRHAGTAEQLGERLLREGDVLINSTGVGTLGRVAQAWQLPEATTVDAHVSIVRADPSILLPELLGAAMLAMQDELEMLGEGSSGQTELSRDAIRNLRVLVPPPSVQPRLGELIRSVQERLAGHQQEARTLLHLRDVLLPAVASGELGRSGIREKDSGASNEGNA